jgi:acyl-coenzyme A synthetase/AMP-(fatty) acid ligase
LRLRKESVKRPVEGAQREPPPEFANLTVDLLKPLQHSKRYAITNVDSLGVIERFTYTEITREAARWAQLLREKGLQPGDRVVIVAGRDWGWRCALLGAIHAGGVAVPCPASLSAREIGTMAEHADASLLVSLRPRPDLVELDGRAALTADDVDAVDPAHALEQPPHRTDPRDIALILYAWHDLDLTGTMHTHDSLLAQAAAAEHWLGVDEDERIWATVDDGSGLSIWLLLAAWRRAASIVVVDLELDSEAKLELLDRLRPVAVWFSDDEYRMLGSAEVPPWVDLRSIRRALVDTEETKGAISFATAFGAALVPVFASDELGVVAGWPAGHEGRADATTAQPTPGVQFAIVGGDGTELPPGEVGEVAVRSDAPTLFTGYAGREGRSRSAEWFRFGWRGALTAEGALRIEARATSEVEPVGASVDLPGPKVAEEPAPEKHVAAGPEPAALGWRARRSAERARRDEERTAEDEGGRPEEAEARESAEREAAEAAERERAEAEDRREREEAEARERAAREAAEVEERRLREEAEARERAERESAAEARQAEDERLAEERRVAEQEKQRDEEQRQRAEEEARRRAEHEAKQRAAVEADERRGAEAEAKERAEKEKHREEERRRDEKEAREREARQAKEREKAEAQERRRAEEDAKIQAKREEAEAKQRAKEEKEREKREAKERVEREKTEAEAAKVQAKIDAAEAKQRAKDEKEREKREAVERAEREKAEAAAAKVQAKIDAAEAKQRAKDEKEREKREAVERAEREKAEAEAAKAQEKQAEVDAKKRAEEEERRAKEREQEEREARRRAKKEAKDAARAERKAARKEKRRPPEAPKPADDRERRFGRRRREVVEEPEPQHVPDVVARIQQYGMAAASNDSPEGPPEQREDE